MSYYVIQVTKPGDAQDKFFWGEGDDHKGPYADPFHAKVKTFGSILEAHHHASPWIIKSRARIVHIANAIREYNPPLRGYTSAERKEAPVHTIMAEYFPDAFMALARHAKKANAKHNGPDAPMQWARKKSTDHLNCAGRHLLTPDAKDPDTGEIEAVCLLWRAAAYVQLQEERRLVAEGIRPLSGVIPDGDT